MMKKILVVLTGGTIGSSLQSGIISANGGSTALSVYQNRYPDEAEFTVCQPMNLLSENLTLRHWHRLINQLLSLPLNDYDGVIITHGSDTLSYSSAMLSMCLSGVQKPVVITASNYVPEHPDSNASVNLHAAVVVINSLTRGVFTVYQNPGEADCAVYLASRICECDRFTGCFSAFDGKPYGVVIGNSFRLLAQSPTPEELRDFVPPLIIQRLPELSKEVLLLRPYPSFPYDQIRLSEHIGAVLQITYHSSTASSEPQNSALTLLHRCREAGVPFYMASFSQSIPELYATSHVLVQNGAIPLYDLSDEAAYAKLLLCCNLPHVPALLAGKDLYFETVPRETKAV